MRVENWGEVSKDQNYEVLEQPSTSRGQRSPFLTQSLNGSSIVRFMGCVHYVCVRNYPKQHCGKLLQIRGMKHLNRHYYYYLYFLVKVHWIFPAPSNLFEVMKTPEFKKPRQRTVQPEGSFTLRMMEEGESDQLFGEEMVDGVIK